MTPVLNPSRPTHVINLAKVLPLFEPAQETRLVPLTRQAEVSLLRTGRTGGPELRRRPTKALVRTALVPIEQRILSVPQVSGTISRALGIRNLTPGGAVELNLPPGMPPIVNAATLKRMLRAKPSDLLLKRVGQEWQICENAMPIDLRDESVEFRLGSVQIFS